MTTKKQSRLSFIAGCISIIGFGILMTTVGCRGKVDSKSFADKQIQLTRDEQRENYVKQTDSLMRTLVVGNNAFQNMKRFILAHGQRVNKTEDWQYVFFDSRGGRHCFVWLNPKYESHQTHMSLPEQITVWGYKNGKKNSTQPNNFVGYEFSADSFRTITSRAVQFGGKLDLGEYDFARRGVQEFAKIN